MTDDDKSLGDDATLGGKSPEKEIDARSLGDQSTHGDHSQLDSVGDSSSLGDQLTFAGDASGEALNDDMEIVDLESRYSIERVLGKGGMGEVLLATDTRLERKVAIKRILGKAARSKTAVNRFLTEAKSVAALNHPNIVQIHDYGRDKQGPFLIMEYVAGESLLECCQQGAIALKEAIELTVQLCDGLAAAHDAHIIHRDIKPANILLTKNNIPKLTDFGLAKAETADTGMTQEGAVLGTHDFMPPEQRKDAALVDARTDLWSLAATLYQMVTSETPRVIDLDAVPRELRSSLAQALKTNKNDRFQTAVEMGTALRECLTASANLPVTELGSGECPSCHTRNEASRKFCNGCAGPLRAPCFGCESEIPVWDKVCGQCGTNQHEKVKQLREQRAKQRAEIEQLLQASEFDKARKQAAVYRKPHDSRVDTNTNWADEMVAHIDEKRKSELKRIAEIMEEATSHQTAFDYAAALTALKQVPNALMDQSVAGLPKTPQELTAELTQTAREAQRLQKILRERLANKEYDGLLEIVEQLQALQPNRTSINRIHDKLIRREEELRANSEKLGLSARTFYDERDYDECLRRISKIPARFLTQEITKLQQTATDKRGQFVQLRKRIEEQYQNQQFQGLMSLIDEYLKQQPGAEEMLKLRNQLVERDKRNAARVAEAVQQAQEMRKSCRFEEAADILGQFNPEMETIESATLFDECQNWHQDRCAAFKAMKRPLRAGGVLPPLVKRYQNALSDSALTDPEFESAYTVYKKQLTEKREAEVAAAQLQQTLIKRGIAVLALVVGVLSILLVLFIRSNLHESAIVRELDRGHYAAVLTLDPQNTESLVMKKRADIKQGLAKGDYQTVLALDPNNTEALAMKKESDVKHAVADGDYGAALLLDPFNPKALNMKQEADIKKALAKGDYRSVLTLDPKNVEAVAMKKKAMIKQALAQEDYRAVLALDPNNADANSMKQADIKQALAKGDYRAVLALDLANAEALAMQKEANIKQALAKGDYRAVLALDLGNAEALAMRKEANIKQALEKGNYKTVLGLDPHNAEALAMKKEAELKRALAMKKEANIKQALALGDYMTVLDLDPNNVEALGMKQAMIKQALAKEDYRAVLALDPNNAEALAMKKKSYVKRALADGDYGTALRLDPGNTEALTMKKEGELKRALAMKKEASIKKALAEGDYRTVLVLDPNNIEAVAMKEADIEQALSNGDYKTVLGLAPNNAEALAMKKSADIQQALAKGDYRSALELGPNNSEALAINKTVLTAQKPTSLTRHLLPVRGVAFSPDGKTIASGSMDSTIRLWDVQTGKDLKMFSSAFDFSLALNRNHPVAFSPDGKTIASGSPDLSIKIRDVQTGKVLKTLSGHSKGITSVAFSPDGKLIASGSLDATVKLWDSKSGNVFNSLLCYPEKRGVSGVAFSPDGKTIASCGYSVETIIWDVQSGKAMNTLSRGASCIAFSPVGEMLAGYWYKPTVQIWHRQTGKLLSMSPPSGRAECMTFSPDGRTLATCNSRGTIQLWDSQSGKQLLTLNGHTGPVCSVAFSPDGQILASGSDDKSIKLWEVGPFLTELDRIKKKYADPSD